MPPSRGTSPFSRSGETGRRTGLKIPRGQPHVGSIPTSGTIALSDTVRYRPKSPEKSGLFLFLLSRNVPPDMLKSSSSGASLGALGTSRNKRPLTGEKLAPALAFLCLIKTGLRPLFLQIVMELSLQVPEFREWYKKKKSFLA